MVSLSKVVRHLLCSMMLIQLVAYIRLTETC